MKNFLSVIISTAICLCFSSCSGTSVKKNDIPKSNIIQNEDVQEENTHYPDSQKIILGDKIVEDKGEFEGVISKKDSTLEGMDMDFVIDDRLALEIGTAVLKSIIGEEEMSETFFLVQEVEKEDIFVVSRLQKAPHVLGGCYSVIISKTNGAVLGAFMGE